MNKLAKYLAHNCITQRGFARKLQTTPNNLNLYVKGKSTPGLRLAYKIEVLTGGLVTMYDWIDKDWKEELPKDL